ncbi:MAG: hypothetical protein E7291_05445 [Lachnospiraceae bacterium]|nr:hypothetical protein [Lachnospiraceae bacterium]
MKTKDITQKNNSGSLMVTILVIVGLFVGLLYFGIGTQIKMANAISVEELLDGRNVAGYGVEGTVTQPSVKFLQLNHRLNGIIPTGADYFYLIFNEDESRCIVYKGSGKWDKEFNETTGYTNTSVEIEGTVKKLPSEVRTYFNSTVSELNEAGLSFVAEAYYIDSSAGIDSIVYIVTAIIIIGLVIIGFAVIKFNVNRPIVKKIGMVLMILLLICLIYIFIF